MNQVSNYTTKIFIEDKFIFDLFSSVPNNNRLKFLAVWLVLGDSIGKLIWLGVR